MTTKELESLFQFNKVPTNYYSFSSPGGGDTYVLDRKNNAWRVYYNERGDVLDEQFFSNEDSACQAMLKKVARMLLSSQHRAMMPVTQA